MSADPRPGTRVVLETERLRLREVGLADADFLQELMAEPSFRRYLAAMGERELDEVREMIRSTYRASYERHGFGLYLVELQEGGEPLGICGLVRRDTLEDVDIGFGFLHRHWSQGYALEAARAVVQHARNLGLPRLVAAAHPQNAASIRLIEKLGMRREGEVVVIPGQPPDALFGLDFEPLD